MFSGRQYCEFGSWNALKLHWHNLRQTPPNFPLRRALESDRWDAAICLGISERLFHSGRFNLDPWVCCSPLSAPTPSLLIKTSIWAPLQPAGSHWSSIHNPPWAEHSGAECYTLPQCAALIQVPNSSQETLTFWFIGLLLNRSEPQHTWSVFLLIEGLLQSNEIEM